MKRKIEFTLPAGTTGAKQAFDIMLSVRRGALETLTESLPEGGHRYQAIVDYDDIDDIAHDAMSVFAVNSIDFLDVDAGLHFTIKREYTLRRTGDDR